MISRKTTRTLSEVYYLAAYDMDIRYHIRYLRTENLYDFLYDHEIDHWFLNIISSLDIYEERGLKDLILRLHTGETVMLYMPKMSLEERIKQGQRLLIKLAEAILVESSKQGKSLEKIDQLKAELELDGYVFKDGKIYYSEASVLDTETEKGILEKLMQDVKLEKQEETKYHLDLSEKHYLEGKWADSISNSRKYLESVLRDVASKHHQHIKGKPISPDIYSQAKEVRKYLVSAGLISDKEGQAIASNYHLLSEEGSHPFIAEKDQARLMRYLALTLSQFILLRFQGFLNEPLAEPG